MRNCIVDPIRGSEEIQRIKDILAGRNPTWLELAKPRDLAIFVAGINNGIRSNDLLGITVGEIRDCLARKGNVLRITERKTGKKNVFVMNDAVMEALEPLLASMADVEDKAPLFRSRMGGGPLRVETLNWLIKRWCQAAKCKGIKFGARTLRKTWGYHARMRGVSIEVIMERYNHTNLRQTRRYLGITEDEIIDALKVSI